VNEQKLSKTRVLNLLGTPFLDLRLFLLLSAGDLQLLLYRGQLQEHMRDGRAGYDPEIPQPTIHRKYRAVGPSASHSSLRRFPCSQPEESRNHLRVEVRSRQQAKMVPDFFLLPGFPVRAVGPEGIPGVYNGEHPRRERDLLPFESPWISSAIPSLVVAIGDRERRPEGRNRVKPLVRIRRVAADDFRLVVRQRSWLLSGRGGCTASRF
jgi:hypothetical protein